MRILDSNNQELTNPDMTLGYIRMDTILVAHHEAVEAVKEVWHYETIAEYSNGGKDVERVIDVPGVEEKEAWDEYENIFRYVLYTAEELAAKKEKESREKDLLSKIAELEEQLAAAKILLGVE